MGESSGFRQFLILLYKGFLLRKRHYVVTFFEIVIPILIASIPAIIDSESSVPKPPENPGVAGRQTLTSNGRNGTTYKPFLPCEQDLNYYLQFVYTPSNNVTDSFMVEAVQRLKTVTRNGQYVNITMKNFTSESDLEIYSLYKMRDSSSMSIVGTVFNNFSPSKKLPASLDYKIRISNPQFLTEMKYRINGPQHYNAYKNTLFLCWQAVVEEIFIEHKMEENKVDTNYTVWMQRFPYPKQAGRGDYFTAVIIVPWVIGYGFLIFIVNIIRRVIEEKANGSKELLKMMGMTNLLYWISTFINYFGLAAVTILIITIVYKAPLKNGHVFMAHSNFFLLLLLLLLFMANLILCVMAFSTFFNRAVFAVVSLIIVYDVSLSLLASKFFLPNTDLDYFSLSLSAKLGICLIPPGALLTVFRSVIFYEGSGQGILWSNLTDRGASPDLNLLMIIGMMVLSCFMYSIIIWYIDAVWPWQYGVPLPFYFPFTKSYWFRTIPKEGDKFELVNCNGENSAEFFEDEPSGVSPGVVIQNLSKEFRTGMQKKLAVSNVNLNIYKGQITALLGHNGAGKTTTINILTGLYSPSRGTAFINGYDISKETTKARKNLGVCPQHNVLYDTLTAEEHLKIYAALKGVEWSKISSEADHILKMLQLSDKRNELTKNLSGGMKRKLSLGISIIGGSKVLFLDEPTSGMDVEARRSVWDALLDLRHQRTIILTTHYMEEADILGDRIAIMAEGEIQCCGSPMYLKRKFGTGYHLHIVKDINFDLSSTTKLIKSYIPGSDLESNFEKETAFSLSSNTDSEFGKMFAKLEDSKKALGINSCGITVTTMEDVFLKVASLSDMKSSKPVDMNDVVVEMEDIYDESDRQKRHRNPTLQLFGLLVKRFHYTKRHWSILAAQLILPFILMSVCLFVITTTSNNYITKYKPLKLDINNVYGETTGFYKPNSNHTAEIVLDNFKSVLKENKVNAKSENDPTSYILNYGEKNLVGYLKTFLVGGSIQMLAHENLNATAWYNGEPNHALPMSLLLMHTALLRYVTDSGSITLTNAPLPYASQNVFYDPVRVKDRILSNIFIPLALAFLSASYVLVPTHERTSKAKLLQLMTGISSALYWLAMFLWDVFIHFLVSILLILPFAIFSHYAFFSSHSGSIGSVLLMVMIYGWASIPFSYLISLIFKKPSTGFSIIILINVLTGVLGVLLTVKLAMKPQIDIGPKVDPVIWIMRIFPSFSLSCGVSNLIALSFNNAFCESIPEKDLDFYCNLDTLSPSSSLFRCCKKVCGALCLKETPLLTMDEEGCGRDIIFLFFDGIFYFLLLLFLETSIFKNCIRNVTQNLRKLKKTVGSVAVIPDNVGNDEEVMIEEDRVNNISYQTDQEALSVLGLTKLYKNFYAVDHLTFGIHHEECFGLLGVNGAGKTTTFRMITGDCHPTEGNALMQDCSLATNLRMFQSRIGYCPQFDALIDRLTGREMLILFARLRGLTGPELYRKVNKLIEVTDLSKHADKQTSVYSGGNKRKLSIALALIGSPPLILLDEPTAGVDPVSRRHIWQILSQARNSTKAAIILTTHSMEESEALCSRLAIMVNGRFRCLGSIQQLKSKYGQGYSLTIKVKRETQENMQRLMEIKNFVHSSLNGANLKDDHQGMLQYHIVDPSVTLSRLFMFMDDMKPKFDLEDYLISDTSLEQIFLTFARAQRVTA